MFVTLKHASTAQPGDKLKLTVRLRDEKQQPSAGEVTLWLVDLAVLSLGNEQPLDPLPSFLQEHRPRTVLRDTRNLLFGLLPLAELPGGGQGPGEEELVECSTVRRRFQSVPYYNPSLEVGPSGVAEVEIALPDNLTVFAVRAKASPGPNASATPPPGWRCVARWWPSWCCRASCASGNACSWGFCLG